MESKFIFLVLSVVLIFSVTACNSKPIACTLDAKICPDGSAVGRVGPNCEFAPCPGPGNEKPDTIVEPGNTVAGAMPCGGWDTFGEVVCECDGQLDRDICPSDAQCDSETYLCKGTCRGCRCYQGSQKDGKEVTCEGRD